MSAAVMGFALGAVVGGGLAALVTVTRASECVVEAHDLAAANERRCKAMGRELRQLRAVSHDMRVMLEGMASRCDVCPRHWCQGEGEPPGTCALDGDLERCGVTLPPSMPRGFVSQCREEDE